MNAVPLTPMRSIVPSSRRRSVLPASYTANRMLDDPPLNTTMQGAAAATSVAMPNDGRLRTTADVQ